MKLIIDREKWYRGAGPYESKLLRPSDGKMCCFGFYLLALGYKKNEILGVGSPCSASIDPSKRPAWLVADSAQPSKFDPPGSLQDAWSSKDTHFLIRTNDYSDISEEKRESRIAEVFGENGVEVEFVGGEPKP